MSRHKLWPYVKHLLAALLRFALSGALILGGAGALLQAGFYFLGQMPHITTGAFLLTSANWALIGGLFGGMLGLMHGLLVGSNK